MKFTSSYSTEVVFSIVCAGIALVVLVSSDLAWARPVGKQNISAGPDARTPFITPTHTPTHSPTPLHTHTPTPTHTPASPFTPTPTHTPTSSPTNTPTLTHTPSPTNTPAPVHLPIIAWDFTPTPTATSTPLSPLPVVANGDFEQGIGVGWSETVNGVSKRLIYPCDEPKDNSVRVGCGGAYLAWLGGVRKATQDVLAQMLTLPAGYTNIGVRYRYFTESQQGTCGVDSSQVEFAGSQQTLNLCSSQATNQWREAALIANGASGAVTLRFSGQLTSGALSSFYVDDVRLCSDDPKAPPGTLPCAVQMESSQTAAAGQPLAVKEADKP